MMKIFGFALAAAIVSAGASYAKTVSHSEMVDLVSYRLSVVKQVNVSDFTCEDEECSVVEVSAVPLPAAGWMLLAGIGGIAVLRRRAKA